MDSFLDKQFQNVVKAYLLVGMIFFWPGLMAYQPQEMFVQYFALLFIGLSFIVPKKRDISNKWLGLVLIYALIHTIFYKFEPIARLQLMNLFLGAITIKVLAERVDLEFKKWAWAFLFFCVLNLVWCGFQHFNVDPLFNPIDPSKKATIDPVGLMGIRYALGCVGSFVSPFLYAIHPLASLIVLPLLYFGQSSSCVLAFAVSMLVLIWFRNRKLFYFMVPLLAIGAILYIWRYDMPSGQFEKRFKIWEFGFNYLAGHDLWRGLGFGAWGTTGFMMLKDNGEPEWWSWAHNDWLQYLFEQGIFGFILLMGYVKNLVKRLDFKNVNSQYAFSVFISLVVITTFHFPFRVGRLACISLFILALMEANSIEQKRQQDEKN